MIDVDVLGVGVWSDAHRGWPAFVAACAAPHDACSSDIVDLSTNASTSSRPSMPSSSDDSLARSTRPSPTLLPPAERRRAPDGVAVALEVASEAVAMASSSAIDATALATVFASAHGDLAIVDYLCTTLATDPTALSPTRFHLSVHNAAAGNWSIATHDQAPSTALAGGDDSFALGLLEAATMAVAERRAVLLVAFDTPAVGLLAKAVRNSALFGFAMIVAPVDATASRATGLALAIEPRRVDPPRPRAPVMRALAASSPAARALALAEALAVRDDLLRESVDARPPIGTSPIRYPLCPASALSVVVRHRERRERPLREQAIE